MGATFSRVKNWAAEILTASDLNAEFDNILTNLTPAGIDDQSASAAAMKVVTDPFPSSTQSLATSLQGEIQRLRYVIKQLHGQAEWYVDPAIKHIGDYSDFETAISTIGSTTQTYLVVDIPAAVPVTGITITGNIHLHCISPGTISLNGDLTFNAGATFSAGLYQIFSGTGAVIFGNGSIEKYPVQWRGAMGDGSTDDTAAIQSVVTDVEASNPHPPIYFPTTGSYYKVTAPIVLTGDNPLILMGDSYITSTIKAVNVTPFSSVISLEKSTHHKYLVFKDINISCNSAASYGIYGEYNAGAGGVSHTLIEHCRVTGALVRAIHLEYGWDIDILRNIITGNVGGIYVANSANALNIIGNKVYSNTGVGIHWYGGYTGNILGNTIEHNTLGGLKIQADYAPNVRGNYFEHNGHDVADERYQIWWGASSASTIGGECSGNVIIGSISYPTGLAGIVLGYCLGSVIKDNYFSNLNYAFDASTLPAITSMKRMLIENNEYDDATVTTKWNPHATYEKRYAYNKNRIRIDGLFDQSNGNLLTRHPVGWTRTGVTGASVAAIIAGDYPSFTIMKATGETASLSLVIDCEHEYEFLRGRYVSLGLTASADVEGSLTVQVGTISHAVTIATSLTEAIVTAKIADDATTVTIYISAGTAESTFTVRDFWFSLGLERPSQKIAELSTRSGAGDPTSSVVPLFIGEEYLNTTGNHWYKAHGTTNADWTALN